MVVGLGALKGRSSEEEPRLDEDSERKRFALMGAMKRRAERSHNSFIQVARLCEANATRRACKQPDAFHSHVIESNIVWCISISIR